MKMKHPNSPSSRSRNPKLSEMTRFIEDTAIDMKNLREEMKLARRLSFSRLDPTSLKPAADTPPGQIEYPSRGVVDDMGLSVHATSSPLSSHRYPTLEEVSRIPSARHFSIYLEDDLDDITDRKPPAVVQELESPDFIREEEEKYVEDIQIEVFPGVFKPLRGSKETQIAWENGLCSQMPCMVCDADLAFVCDCEFVICPVCRAVVLVDAAENGLHESIPSLQSLQSSLSSFLSESEPRGESCRLEARQRPRGVGLGIRVL